VSASQPAWWWWWWNSTPRCSDVCVWPAHAAASVGRSVQASQVVDRQVLLCCSTDSPPSTRVDYAPTAGGTRGVRHMRLLSYMRVALLVEPGCFRPQADENSAALFLQ
jgi:hypothetical protein